MVFLANVRRGGEGDEGGFRELTRWGGMGEWGS